MRLSYRGKLWFSISFFSTLVTIFTFLIFGLVYYYLSGKSLRSGLLSQTNELIRSHLIVKDNQIFFQKDKEGNSLSAYLRDEDLSATIFDSNRKIIATYGIFSDNSISKNTNNINNFYTLTYGQKDYLTFITPIKKNDTTYGYVLLSKSSQLQNDFNRLALFILPPIIILSSLLGWLFSSKLANILLLPLEKLILAINTSDYHSLSSVVNPTNSSDHLSRLQTSYNLMVERLTKGYEEQKLFISRASHELKTPLANLLSTVELLELDLQDNKVSSLAPRLTQIKKILHAQSQQVDDLLSLSSLTYSTLDYEIIQLYDFFQSLTSQFQKELADKSLVMKNQVDPNISISFPKKHLQLIFQNLISNAIKYNKSGGSITLAASNIGDNLSLSITDTGYGISPDDLTHIFDPFFRSSSTSQKVAGSGIGLSLIKQICSQQGLIITVTSQLDVYTTFTISGFK